IRLPATCSACERGEPSHARRSRAAGIDPAPPTTRYNRDSGFGCRLLAGDALPQPARHAYPSICPALMSIDFRALAIHAFPSPGAGCDSDVTEDSHFHITNSILFPLAALETGEQRVFAGNLAVCVGVD